MPKKRENYGELYIPKDFIITDFIWPIPSEKPVGCYSQSLSSVTHPKCLTHYPNVPQSAKNVTLHSYKDAMEIVIKSILTPL